MNSYFYVDTDDEITSVIGKLRGEKAEEIFLVVPKRALIAQSLVNLRLLDKEAKRHQKKLVFVSPDAHIRKLAEKAGLAVKKYVTKPKNEEKQNALTLAPKARKLEPWEEEAAKQELASIIKKEEPAKKIPSGTRIAVGAFSKLVPGLHREPEKIIARPVPGGIRARQIAKKGAEVVDLKKTRLHRKPMVFSQKKLKPTSPEKQPNTQTIKRKPILSKKEKLPQEDVDKKTSDSKMDIAKNVATEKNKPSLKIGENPFKIRKIALRKEKIIPKQIPKPPIISPEVNYQKEDIENPPDLIADEVSETQKAADYKRHEREMANLTLKEKERLRDLWMEQKGLVRGRFTQDKASLDLSAKDKTKISENQFVSQSSGLFKTTHRKVGGPSKIVDLRSGNQTVAQPSPNDLRATISQENFSKNAQKEKKVVLLPLINIRIFSLFVLIILVILMVLAGIIIPDAHVTLKPKVSESNISLKATVSGEVSQVDISERIIPGQPVRFKINEEKNFAATGTKEIKVNAQGQVTIYNNNEAPLSLKQNALLTDSSGKKFYTQAPILIPAGIAGSANSNTNSNEASIKAGVATVTIQGEGIGADYELKEGAKLTIPGLAQSDFGSGVTVEIKKAVSGGENRTVKVVTREDLDKAKAELLDKVRQDSLGELENALGADSAKIAKPDSLKEEDITYTTSKAEGDEANSFNANLAVNFFTLAFSQKELNEMGKSVIESESSQKGGTVSMKNYQVNDAQPLENKMEISADLSYQIKSQIDEVLIRKELVAKKRNEAEEYLRGNLDIEQFTLDLWPSWPARLPILERRIKVEIQP